MVNIRIFSQYQKYFILLFAYQSVVSDDKPFSSWKNSSVKQLLLWCSITKVLQKTEKGREKTGKIEITQTQRAPRKGTKVSEGNLASAILNTASYIRLGIQRGIFFPKSFRTSLASCPFHIGCRRLLHVCDRRRFP